MAGVVDRLQGHATGEGPVADHRHATEILAAGVAGQGHAQGSGNACGGVAGAEVVEAAFAALQITGHPVLLAEGMEAGVTAGDQFVGIGLVAHVPDHLVPVQVEGLVEGEGELHNPQARAEVAAAGGDHLQMFLADLAGDRLEFRGAQTVELVRVTQLAEVHDRFDLNPGNLRVPFRRSAAIATVCAGQPPRRGRGHLPHWSP